jgi:hypothetical protein
MRSKEPRGRRSKSGAEVCRAAIALHSLYLQHAKAHQYPAFASVSYVVLLEEAAQATIDSRSRHRVAIIGWVNVSVEISKALYAIKSGLMQESFKCQTCIRCGGDEEGARNYLRE